MICVQGSVANSKTCVLTRCRRTLSTVHSALPLGPDAAAGRPRSEAGQPPDLGGPAHDMAGQAPAHML